MRLGEERRPARGPGANGGRHQPDPHAQAPGLPAGVTYGMAEEIAAGMERWQGYRGLAKPGPITFEVSVVTLNFRRPDDAGEVRNVTEQHVQLIAATATGPTVMFVPPDLAAELAAQLLDKVDEARTGITVPRTVLQVAD